MESEVCDPPVESLGIGKTHGVESETTGVVVEANGLVCCSILMKMMISSLRHKSPYFASLIRFWREMRGCIV